MLFFELSIYNEANLFSDMTEQVLKCINMCHTVNSMSVISGKIPTRPG